MLKLKFSWEDALKRKPLLEYNFLVSLLNKEHSVHYYTYVFKKNKKKFLSQTVVYPDAPSFSTPFFLLFFFVEEIGLLKKIDKKGEPAVFKNGPFTWLKSKDYFITVP